MCVGFFLADEVVRGFILYVDVGGRVVFFCKDSFAFREF